MLPFSHVVHDLLFSKKPGCVVGTVGRLRGFQFKVFSICNFLILPISLRYGWRLIQVLSSPDYD